jgi:hypothetical protein
MLEGVVEAGLREIVATRRMLDSIESKLVAKAREDGATWAQLGELLGLTRQGARARHLIVDPVSARTKGPDDLPTMAEYHAEIAALVAAEARSAREPAVDD